MAQPVEGQPTNDYGKPPPRWILKTFTKINVLVYKLSSGRLMNKISGMPIVLVTMKGAKSGRTITIPLMYVPHRTGFILVACQGGKLKNPAWYHNLVKNPEIEITHEGRSRKLTARRVDEDEKATLWPTCIQYYPPYEQYQKRTERQIPVFLCE
jgi:deazaflavin-dependent oxidoreductase (nitroreductase family)